MKSKVYVIQNQQVRDRVSRKMKPKFDLAPAEDYGKLIYLLDSSDLPFNSAPVIEKLREGLAEYSLVDYLLLIGNPCLIGWATTIAVGASGGFVRMLQWHTQSQSYISVDAKFCLAKELPPGYTAYC